VKVIYPGPAVDADQGAVAQSFPGLGLTLVPGENEVREEQGRVLLACGLVVEPAAVQEVRPDPVLPSTRRKKEKEADPEAGHEEVSHGGR
jgi:hypothetical protein